MWACELRPPLFSETWVSKYLEPVVVFLFGNERRKKQKKKKKNKEVYPGQRLEVILENIERSWSISAGDSLQQLLEPSYASEQQDDFEKQTGRFSRRDLCRGK
jgi:hypothetical protein